MKNGKKTGFVKFPRALLTDEAYRAISVEAKLLYALMLDRVGVSEISGWKDAGGKTYIYYTMEEAQRVIGCGHDKACKVLAELDREGLIRRVRQGQGRPMRIYVHDVFGKTADKTSEKPKARQGNAGDADFGKTDTIYTEANYTEGIYTHPSSAQEWDECREETKDAIDYEFLRERYPEEFVAAVLEVIVEHLCSTKKNVRIGGREVPSDMARERYRMLDRHGVEYVLDGLQRSKTEIRSLKRYLAAALFDAPIYMEAYYAAMVRRDYDT